MSAPTVPSGPPGGSTSGLQVRTVTEDEHRAFLATRRSASFLQTPAWAKVKQEWGHESLGWFRSPAAGATGGAPGDPADAALVGPVGVGLVLYREAPRIRRSLAYLPEGPVIDWTDPDLAAWLAPLVAHLRSRGAFGVRIGPPLVSAAWRASRVKEGLADPAVHRLADLPADHGDPVAARVAAELRRLGWQQQSAEGGFAAGQPQYNFQIPLRDASGQPRTEDDVLRGMNQLWRRNIRRAEREGVEVTSVTPAEAGEDLKSFHDLYVHTAVRDHFTPRPLSYFRTMLDALGHDEAAEPDRIRLWFARHEGELVAATISIRVGGHVWYSYGASSSERREVRGSNAIQWAMIRYALAAGADVYDLRGITDTLDPDDPHAGLIQFKVGTGGEAVAYLGEWDLPLSRVLYPAFRAYLRWRR